MINIDVFNALQHRGFNKVVINPSGTAIQKERPTYDDTLRKETEYVITTNGTTTEIGSQILDNNKIIIYNNTLIAPFIEKIFINGLFATDYVIVENDVNVIIEFTNLQFSLESTDTIEVFGYFTN